MPDENPTVYIVDDDPDFRESMSLMVRSMGLSAAVYPSAETFLDGYAEPSDSPKCMVLDVRMSGLSGHPCEGGQLRQNSLPRDSARMRAVET